MAVPDYQSFMLPVLRYAGARPNEEIASKSLVDAMAKEFNLNQEDLQEMLPSGVSTTLGNRVGWASTYLTKARLLERPKRGHIKISDRGVELLSKKPNHINTQFLRQYPEFVQFQSSKSPAKNSSPEPESSQTPQEQIDSGYRQMRTALAGELLEKLKQTTPAFFERTVVDLLVRMGYGGSLKDAGKAIGKSGDEGIDGIIKEDKLGLDAIYIQAKRWIDRPVGRPEIQQFAGALAGQGAHKGIFITTSSFTSEARAFITKVNSKIVLIDGDELAEMMIDHSIGVTTMVSYDLKRIDSDYFVETE